MKNEIRPSFKMGDIHKTSKYVGYGFTDGMGNEFYVEMNRAKYEYTLWTYHAETDRWYSSEHNVYAPIQHQDWPEGSGEIILFSHDGAQRRIAWDETNKIIQL